uniref:Nuclear pore complex protein Nup98-Nup96 (inferred by orthology to a C. elegans protein) n=1 Tax=Anisakis simplex TaxID=6269 RepID=A0A0M3K774_ANISI
LRCEDYIANRRGATTGGGLTFGQTQPTTSTSLFGGNTATTQSSLFGAQNKSLFGGGTSSAFGTTTTSTTTPSLFGASTTTGQSSLFGSANKPATGLFGTQQATATTSPFGQTQQQTTGGLFGAKPTTGFGTQPTTSLFGGSSSFGSTTTASPFTFGSNTATATPFGQTQTTSAFGGTFGQTTASTATSGGLFGAKPAATGGFGGFGTNTATSAPFGSQPSGVGLFGAKPAGGSLFGSTSGFNVAPTAANVMTAQTAVAPIVLGSDVNQTAIQNAIIEAQLASCPYGDSPLLKLVSSETLKKSDIPSPTNLQRQMRFLASKAKGGSGGGGGAAMSSATTLVSTTTTRTTPAIALSSLPTAGSPINISVQPSSNNLLNSSRPFNHLSYKSIYSSPNSATTALSNPPPLTDSAVSRPSILKHGSANASMFSAEAGSGRGKADETRNDVKRLDLNRLKKSLEAGKQRHPLSSSQTAATTSAVSSPSSVNGSIQQDRTDHDTASTESQQHNVNGEMQNGDLKSTGLCRPVLSPETENVREKRRAELRKEQPPIRLNLNSDYNTSTDVGARSVISAKPHPAGITLRRRDYVCEPSLEQLAVMAERNNGVCRIEKGFTIRRFGYGSVFWPGPFDLSNIDIDEVVHFRQNEVIVYPDDSNKPSVGEKLNRFAEISLERDPIELERMHFREKLERVSARMDANFKDYRPETGTWVFTVPHFTKYGLPVR